MLEYLIISYDFLNGQKELPYHGKGGGVSVEEAQAGRVFGTREKIEKLSNEFYVGPLKG